MCHTVKQRRGCFIETENEDLLLGLKLVRLKGKTVSGMLEEEYKKSECKIEDLDAVCFRTKVTMQEIRFMLRLYQREGQVHKTTDSCRKLPGGIHISPIGKQPIHCLSKLPNIVRIFNTPKTIITIPAFFLREDIVMFDGVDVSVERFFVLDHENLKKVIRIKWLGKMGRELIKNNKMLFEKIR